MIFGRCPCRVSVRGIEAGTRPVHANIVIGRIPASNVNTETDVGVNTLDAVAGFFHKVVNGLDTEFKPTLKIRWLRIRKVTYCRTGRHNIVGEIGYRMTDILLELQAGVLREIAVEIIEASAVKDDAIEFLIRGEIREHIEQVTLHFFMNGVKEPRASLCSVQRTHNSVLRQQLRSPLSL